MDCLTFRQAWGWLIALLASVLFQLPVGACELCGRPTVTLLERVAEADVVLLVEWVELLKPTDEATGITRFRLVERSPASSQNLKRGIVIDVPGEHDGEKGDLRLLAGKGDPAQLSSMRWLEPHEISRDGWDYLIVSPSIDTPWPQRLRFAFQYLEHADPQIATDAHAQFVNAPANAVAEYASDCDPEKLRTWLRLTETPSSRRGVYWVLLGYCGGELDIEWMERELMRSTTEVRLELAGLVFGFLQLRGEVGLDLIQRRFLGEAAQQDSTDLNNEIGDALRAVGWCWDFGRNQIPRERVAATFRRMAFHPAHGGFVLTSLARWRDWSQLDKVAANYGTPEFRDLTTRRSFARYLVSASLDHSGEKSTEDSVSQRAVRHIKQLTQRSSSDARIFAAAESLLNPPQDR